jgi:DNA polymerase I
LQTLPKAGPIRSLIIPREGYKFVIADYSQFEARIALGLSQDKHGLAIFQSGKDIYREFAGVITGKSEGEVGEFRKVSKGIVLGLLNGKTEYSIHADLGLAGIDLSLDEVRELIEKFHGYFSGLKSWQDRVVQEALTSGYARTALGRRRYLDQVVDNSNAANRIKNFPIQGTASDGFKIALCRLDEKFKELRLDAHLVLTLHDEIVIEARDELVGQVVEVIDKCLKEAFMNIILGMPFELEMKIAEAWGD